VGKKNKKKGQDFLDYANQNNIQINLEYEENKYLLKKTDDQRNQKQNKYQDKKPFNKNRQNKNWQQKKPKLSGNKFDMVGMRPYTNNYNYQQQNTIQLTDDKQIVLNAIEKSNKLELSDDKERIRRKIPLPTREEIDKTTIKVYKFKETEKEEDILDFLTRFGEIDCYRFMYNRENKKYVFTGCVYIKFDTEIERDRYLRQTIVYKGFRLQMERKNQKMREDVETRLDKEAMIFVKTQNLEEEIKVIC